MDQEAFEAIATLGLLAAFADGQSADAERAKLSEIFESFGPVGPEVYRRVLMKETGIAREVARLHSPETRQLAYEMAVAVCDADGATNPAETAFLAELRQALGLGGGAAALETDAAALAAAPLDTPDPLVDAAPAALPPAPIPAAAATTTADPEVDAMILKYAVLNGALELLPQSLATMAILPLQMKMVYRIGARHGIALDQGHIKEFLGVAGLGITSQVFENVARKFLGKAAKMALGKSFGRLAKGAVGPAMTFATTYAIGQVAKAYYGGGRTLRPDQIRSLFEGQLRDAQGLYSQHAGAITAQSKTLDMGSVLSMVRGGR
jgi:uncharacterized protein (DUF697 family)/tellurite resistance protein